MKQYPHEMSGGMRQRVMIGMALSCEPKLLIADEPTTALDVTIQAQILELLKSVQQRTKSALILITHDLGVVAEMVDRVVVMYAGQVVEQGTVEQVLTQPTDPYTMGLIESLPNMDRRGQRLSAIKGVVPSPFNMPPACRFAPRCPYAWEQCDATMPELIPSGAAGQLARCHLHAPMNAARRRELFGSSGARPPTARGWADPMPDQDAIAGRLGRRRPARTCPAPPGPPRRDELLTVRGLKKHFPIYGGLLKKQVATVYAVDGVDFHINRNEVYALVGESGSGKTTLGRAILRLAEPTAGTRHLRRDDVTALERQRRSAGCDPRCRSCSRTRSGR